jgi:hypothetical protein
VPRGSNGSVPTNPESLSVNGGDVLNKLYLPDGIYHSLHDVAFDLGQTSLGGNVAVLREGSADKPREMIMVSAKRNGGVVVSRDLVNSHENTLFSKYQLLLPSTIGGERCQLIRRGRGSEYIRTALLPQFMPYIITPGLSDFAMGVDHALDDVAAVTGIDTFTSMKFNPAQAA